MASTTTVRAHRRTASTVLAVTAAAGLVLVAPSTADAGPRAERGGPSRSSSVTMVPVNTADPAVNHGDQVTFTVSTTVTDRPMVKLYCYQAGAEVYWASAGFFADYPWPWARDFTLKSDYWTGGAADCTATLYYSAGHNKFPTLATTSFHVEG